MGPVRADWGQRHGIGLALSTLARVRLNCYNLLGVGGKPEERWLCFEVTVAGGGCRLFGDGIDAYCFNNRLKNAPVEFVETVYPLG